MTFVIGTACVVGGTSSTAAFPHLGDGVEHGGQLTGEEVELLVGHRQPGQVRQVRDFVRSPSGRACSCCGGTPLRWCATARFSAGNVTRPLYVGPSGARPARNRRERLHRTTIDGDRPAPRGRPGGTVSYLLRLVVPDRPGILGAVATALGDAGVDIVSLDVLERGHGVAVDDVVVDLPRDRLPDSLITAAQAVPGVTVESIRPFAGPLDTHRELELLESLARAAEGTTAKLLAAELPRVFHSGWAVVLAVRAPVVGGRRRLRRRPGVRGRDAAVDAAAGPAAAAERGRLAARAVAGHGHRDDGRPLRRRGVRRRPRPLGRPGVPAVGAAAAGAPHRHRADRRRAARPPDPRQAVPLAPAMRCNRVRCDRSTGSNLAGGDDATRRCAGCGG